MLSIISEKKNIATGLVKTPSYTCSSFHRASNVYDQQYNISQEECQSRCSSELKCLAYSFISHQQCSLSDTSVKISNIVLTNNLLSTYCDMGKIIYITSKTSMLPCGSIRPHFVFAIRLHSKCVKQHSILHDLLTIVVNGKMSGG